MSMKRSILVPHDFSEVGDYALQHAYLIIKASKSDYPINLLHVIKKDSMYDESLAKLNEIAKDFSEKHKVTVNTKVIKGNIYKTIYAYGVESKAFIAVMGTHGIKNVKKAMKVVKKFVKIPFILVQSESNFGEYNKLVIPLDHNVKSRIKFRWVRFLNDIFESKAYIIATHETDNYKAESLNNNIKFSTNFLEDELIDYELKKLENKMNFADEVYNYAHEVEGDLILVMADQYKQFAKDLNKAENLEYFKKIPIMCVNKRTDIVKHGGFS